MLEETPSNAESTTLELLETQFPTLEFTAHTLERAELEFAEELPQLLLPPQPLEESLLLPLLLLQLSWFSP